MLLYVIWLCSNSVNFINGLVYKIFCSWMGNRMQDLVGGNRSWGTSLKNILCSCHHTLSISILIFLILSARSVSLVHPMILTVTCYIFKGPEAMVPSDYGLKPLKLQPLPLVTWFALMLDQNGELWPIYSMQSNKNSIVEGSVTPGRASPWTKDPSLYLPLSLKTSLETNVSVSHERLLLVGQIHPNASKSSHPD